MKPTFKTLFCSALMGLLLSASAAWSFPGFVIKKDGSRLKGEEIRAKSNGNIVLRRGPGPIEFKKGTFKEAWAAKPQQWDAVERAVQSGKYEEAIPVLQDIIKTYKFLGWDARATPMLGKAQMETGQVSEALKTFDQILASNPKAGEADSFKAQYWKALLTNKKIDEVEPRLNEAIETGSRELAAQAQLLRGDLRVAKSLYEDALLDYLRTATLFEKVKDVQPEALLKTAQTFETLKDSRAKKFYKKVVDEYPQSDEAIVAQSKI